MNIFIMMMIVKIMKIYFNCIIILMRYWDFGIEVILEFIKGFIFREEVCVIDTSSE